ncbi:hypothetical protein IHE44_0014104 [Lamprotornis superbus]|uniref:MOB kinase activator 2 n=1 Tax=Lamprotornis superbus TaxID=245042 RepID=A0A835NN60_9PASS|nr:hypothetical protein IHE44_0014104 [Lamprotornis superbus]
MLHRCNATPIVTTSHGDQELCDAAGPHMGSFINRAVLLSPLFTGLRREQCSPRSLQSHLAKGQQNEAMEEGMQEEQCKGKYRSLDETAAFRKSKGKPNGKKPAPEEKKLYLEPEYTKSRITDFEFKELVMLPREIDLNEWLASNTTTFFHHINLQYSTISEFCTGESCQTMAVCNTQYYWYDERGKKIKCTAPQYVDFVMSSVQKLVTDEDVFPTKYGKEFPNSFESLVKKICKYLFHAHLHSSSTPLQFEQTS